LTDHCCYLQPLGVQGNDLANTALARVTEALTLLTEAGQLLEDGGNIWSYPARTAALQTELLDAEAAARRKFQIIIISASVFAIAFSLAAVASWSFVIKLRNRERTFSSISPDARLISVRTTRVESEPLATESDAGERLHDTGPADSSRSRRAGCGASYCRTVRVGAHAFS
jgi:hypothetical protein